MKNQDFDSLLSSLDTAVAILNRNRTPDPELIAAFDTLKQARAMIAKALASNSDASAQHHELAAA